MELWRAMAKGIADGTNGKYDKAGVTDYSTTLMTYHCFSSSSQWFQHDDWLDFNMWGSYHSDYSITKPMNNHYPTGLYLIRNPQLTENRLMKNMPSTG